MELAGWIWRSHLASIFLLATYAPPRHSTLDPSRSHHRPSVQLSSTPPWRAGEEQCPFLPVVIVRIPAVAGEGGGRNEEGRSMENGAHIAIGCI
jgi:hypothetical protein